MTYTEMLHAHDMLSAADMYNLGFIYHKSVYSIMLPKLPDYCIKEDHASSKRGGGKRLRVRLNRAAKEQLLALGAELLGGEELLEDAKYNRGERYEQLITERAGNVWVKDSVPFNVAGDTVIKGKQVQIKLDGATLVNELTLVRLIA
jgi:hypothetical protein